MGAFIIAGIIFGLTLVACILMVFAAGMSDAPSQDSVPVVPTFIGGTIIAALVAASHWMPHINW